MNQSQELTLSSNAYRTISAPPPEKEFKIPDLLNLLKRRRAIVLSSVTLFLILATIVCVFSTRRYLSTATIQVQKESSSQLGLDSPGDSENSSTDSLQDTITLQTQASILESDSLALKVISDLNLGATEDFKPTFEPLGWVLGLISPDGPPDAQLGPPNAEDFGLSPRERRYLLKVFAKNLKVKPEAGTRLIDVSYLSSSPKLSAEVVNHLVQGLSDYNFQTRHDATARTAEYLTGQLTDLRKQSEELQTQLARAQRDSGVVSLGGIDAQGREQVYSAVLDKLQQATITYTQAESNRIAKESVYEAVKTGDPEAISTITGGAVLSNSGDMGGLPLIQSLRLQQTTLKGLIAEASAKYGPAFPKLAEMQQNLAAVDASIATEVARAAERAKNDADVARGVEASTRREYNDLKSQADSLNDKTIAYTILRQEADQSRTLYDTLFKQLKEAGVLADFKVSNVSIVDPGRVPSKPAKPNVPLYLAAAIVGGLFFGFCGALLQDMLDSKISSLSDLEAQLGHLPLGVLPYHEKVRNLRKPISSQAVRAQPRSLTYSQSSIPVVSLAAVTDPRSAYVEALRGLRTSIFLSRGGAPPQVILVTSSIAAEGKSMLSVNLAALLAQQDKRVLLIDGDFRRPTLHRQLKISNSVGLSSFLAGHAQMIDPETVGVPVPDVPGLMVLPAGPVPPYPAELLGSEQMRCAVTAWRTHFDFIVIDGAPVLPVTDSVILSTMVDFTLLLARYEMTERQSLDRSYRLLQGQANINKIGIVLNAVQRDSSTYYQYYGYKDSVYYGAKQNA